MSNDSSSSEWELYRYTPSKGAAIALAVLFIVTTLIYSFQVVWDARKASKPEVDNPFDTPVGKCESITTISLGENYKKLTVKSTFSAFIPLFFGCIMEIVGYIARAVSSSNTKEIAPYVIQAVLLLIAPALYAATIYMLFGRLLHVMRCESLMIVSSRFETSFFVFGDVVSFCLQAAGGGLMATVNGRTTGSNLITAGLVIQIAFFGFFIINEFRFSYSVARVCPFYRHISKKWWFLNLTLLLSSVLIMVRSIVRLIEFVEGYDGFIISHEYFIYVFDAVPMLLAAIVFIVGSYFGNIFTTITECQSLKS
ncbi:Y55_G0052380.mRNA.1.CDS.1 [Saccharomyces cerevisiae]|nr:Y55_G0052380.mRNA.1.CDS.1 [Saccharomyces cerevisiae]